jgi:hypothetical protein
MDQGEKGRSGVVIPIDVREIRRNSTTNLLTRSIPEEDARPAVIEISLNTNSESSFPACRSESDPANRRAG